MESCLISLGMCLTACASKLMPESTEGCFLSLSLMTVLGWSCACARVSRGAEAGDLCSLSSWVRLGRAERMVAVLPRGDTAELAATAAPVPALRGIVIRHRTFTPHTTLELQTKVHTKVRNLLVECTF